MRRCCAVLVNYFGAAETAAAALAVLIDAPGVRVLVVDNSHDAAEHALLQALLPRTVEVLDAGGNLGFGRACNLAWHASRDEFVRFVNPDVRLRPGCTAALVDAMRADPTLAAVAPRQYLDLACRWHLPPAWLPTPMRAWSHEKALRDPRAWHRLATAARAEGLRLWQADTPVTQRALSGGVFMLRRSALPENESPFDPRFFMYFEDSDLCMRLRRRGLRLAVQPQATAVHAWQNLPHKAHLMSEAAAVYFSKYDPSATNPWHARAGDLAATPARLDARPAFSPWPTRQGLQVPEVWHNGWVLELGLSPLLQTVVARCGTGPVIEEPTEVLAQLGVSDAYGRLGPRGTDVNGARPFLYFHWPAGLRAPAC